jgi:DNA-binding FadR family transcriptional regulator
MLRNLKSGKLQDLAKEQIKALILDTGLKSGDQLPTESTMAQKLGVSKTTVREALKALANVGILESRHGVGTFVKEFSYEAILENLPYSLETDVSSLREIVEIRACLERHFLVHDIEKFDSEDIRDLWSIFEDLEKATLQKDMKDEIDIHAAFHCALYRHCGNRLLIRLIEIFATLQRNLALVNRYQGTDPDSFLMHHRIIIEAIEKKDAEMATAALRRHFADVLDWLSRESART